MRNIFFISLLALLVSCDHQIDVPDQYLQKEEMAEVMTELLMAQALLDQYSIPRDSARQVFQSRLKLPILEKKGVDLAQFDSSYVFYSKDAELMHEVWTMVNDEVKRRSESGTIFVD